MTAATRANDAGALRVRRIESRDDAAVARIIRDVMTEHGATGPGFAIHDAEVDAMCAAYAASDARYWVVVDAEDAPIGGAGFGRLAGTSVEEATCELRKMYFRAKARGRGFGRSMLETAMREAAAIGYRTMYLETLASMGDAERLYRAAGFERLKAPRGATGHCGCDRWYARRLP